MSRLARIVSTPSSTTVFSRRSTPVTSAASRVIDARGLGVLDHVVGQHVPGLGLGKPGEVRHLVGDGQVAAAEPEVDHDGLELGLGAVDARGDARRPTAQNQHVGLGLHGLRRRARSAEARLDPTQRVQAQR